MHRKFGLTRNARNIRNPYWLHFNIATNMGCMYLIKRGLKKSPIYVSGWRRVRQSGPYGRSRNAKGRERTQVRDRPRVVSATNRKGRYHAPISMGAILCRAAIKASASA